MSEESSKTLLSIVVPVFNEAAGLASFNENLTKVLAELDINYEIVYVDDGSSDSTNDRLSEIAKTDKHLKILRLTTNFGKENALSAGIAAARGEAILMIDGDGQHPVSLIPEFVADWKKGSKLVIGIRLDNRSGGLFEKAGSKFFYMLINRISKHDLKPGSDFRLIDKDVRRAFLRLKERDRITRGLIDWLGYKPTYIKFSAEARTHGKPTYSKRKLFKLAALSFVSLSPTPLYIFSYLGAGITLLSALTGITVIIEQLILGDPLHWKFTGTAMLGILLIFLVGLVLISQGIMSLYISHIHAQSKQRPLYVVDYDNSLGISRNDPL